MLKYNIFNSIKKMKMAAETQQWAVDPLIIIIIIIIIVIKGGFRNCCSISVGRLVSIFNESVGTGRVYSWSDLEAVNRGDETFSARHASASSCIPIS
jgi:hypothetical protein